MIGSVKKLAIWLLSTLAATAIGAAAIYFYKGSPGPIYTTIIVRSIDDRVAELKFYFQNMGRAPLTDFTAHIEMHKKLVSVLDRSYYEQPNTRTCRSNLFNGHRIEVQCRVFRKEEPIWAYVYIEPKDKNIEKIVGGIGIAFVSRDFECHNTVMFRDFSIGDYRGLKYGSHMEKDDYHYSPRQIDEWGHIVCENIR